METEGVGTQEHTVAFHATAGYEPRHRARPTFREWWEEILLVAPAWAFAVIAAGAAALLTALIVGVIVYA